MAAKAWSMAALMNEVTNKLIHTGEPVHQLAARCKYKSDAECVVGSCRWQGVHAACGAPWGGLTTLCWCLEAV